MSSTDRSFIAAGPEIIDVIMGRRSIRRGMDGRPIPRAALELIIRSALTAPSSKNAQPWRLHIVSQRSDLAAVAADVDTAAGAVDFVPIDPATGQPRSGYRSTVAESAAVLRQASAGLFVENLGGFSGGRALLAAHPASLKDALVGYTFEVLGIGAAVQNAWLAAEAVGLVGVFMGDILIAEAAIRTRLEMAGDLVGVLALGYSTQPPHADRELHHDRARWHTTNPSPNAASPSSKP